MKHSLLTILLLLLLGAVVNVGVAWLLALADARRDTQRYFFNDGSKKWGVMHITGLGMDEYTLFFDADGFDLRRQESLGYGSVPEWARWRGAPGQNWVEWTDAFGWPFRCLLFGAVQPSNPPPLVTRWGALPVRPRSGFLFRGWVPLVPLWMGMIAGTLFYAALLWLLIPGPFVLRRFLQLRRGLCPKCAYPMGESAVCTECGQSACSQRALFRCRSLTRTQTGRATCRTTGLHAAISLRAPHWHCTFMALAPSATEGPQSILSMCIVWAGPCIRFSGSTRARRDRRPVPSSPSTRGWSAMRGRISSFVLGGYIFPFALHHG